MLTAAENIYIQQGATFRQVFQWQDASGNAINLTGYTGRCQIRESYSSSAVVADMTTENGGVIISAADGKVTLYLTAAQTEELSFTEGVYDIELIIGSDVFRLVYGKVTLLPEVTR